MRTKCLNPHCGVLHEWNMEVTKNYDEGLCPICRAQLASILIHSKETYFKCVDELKQEFDKGNKRVYKRRLVISE